MDPTEDALNKAYGGQVVNLFGKFVTSLATADSDAAKDEAQQRFKAGLDLARDALDRAKAAADIE